MSCPEGQNGMRIRRCAQSAATAVLLVALAACGEEGVAETVPGSQASDDTGPVVEDAQQVECRGISFDLAELSEAPSVSSLPEGPAGAVDDMGAPAFDPSLDWKVVSESDERVDLVRELEQPLDNGQDETYTHEGRTLTLITGAPNVPDGWMKTSAGECTLRVPTDGDLKVADLSLANVPSPATTTVDLLVRERACASGEPADGRIEVIELVETAEQVRLRVGVKRQDGDQSCQGNPPTPFTVELSAPLGEREIVDWSIVPARPLAAEGR